MLAAMLLSFIIGIYAQTDVAIQGLGVAGNNAAGFGGAGLGANVQADGALAVTDSLASSAVQVIATGPVQTPSRTPITPRPTSVPRPKPTTKPSLKTHPVPHPSKKVVPYYPKPKCEDIKDGKCYKIDDYKYCGFCVEQYYPLKGYACKYDYENVLKKTGSKKEYSYDKVLSPKCDCKGEFIIKKDDCPDCDDLLHKLFKCAGVKDTAHEVEISKKCLKETGISIEVLIKCGYVEVEKDDKKVVVVKKDKEVEHKPVVLKINKEEHKPVPVKKHHKPTYATVSVQASASASASANGGSAVAEASAIASTGRKL